VATTNKALFCSLYKELNHLRLDGTSHEEETDETARRNRPPAHPAVATRE
jgi:hypothetical protein